MRVARPAVALAVVTALVASGAASAATRPRPKPVCRLVVDAPGDASRQSRVRRDDSLDVLSADLASSTRTVTAVIRVKDLGATSPTAVSGRSWTFLFSVPSAENPIYFTYQEDALGGFFDWGDLEPGQGGVDTYTSKGDATGRIVPAKNEIRISVPVRDVNALGRIAPGTRVASMRVETSAVLGVLVQPVDTAASSRVYVAGYPSCVVPGT